MLAGPERRRPAPGASPARATSPRRHLAVVLAAIAVDLAAVAASIILPALLRFTPDQLVVAATARGGIALALSAALVWMALLSAREAYAPRVMVSTLGQVVRVASAAVLAWVLTHLLAFVLKEPVPFASRLAVLLSLPAALLSLAAVRLLIVRPLALRAYPRLSRGPILVLGDTPRAERLAREIEERNARGRPVITLPLSSVRPDDIQRPIDRNGVGEVVIEPDGRSLDEVFEIAFAAHDAKAEVRIVSPRFRVVEGRSAIGGFDGVPVLRFRRVDLVGPESVVKRLVDIAGAGLGLALLSPLLLAIAILIKATSRGPVLYRQERVGRRGRRFRMLKFRSMEHGNDSWEHRAYLRRYIQGGAPATVAEDGTKIYKLTADSRVTRVGAWLRALSLDELPQLWNVLRGEMSLVGPRPCLPYEWEMYRPWQRRRLDVVPGCTGLWQVTARSLVNFEEMVILDLHYAHHGSIASDLGLIVQTFPAMVRGRGGY